MSIGTFVILKNEKDWIAPHILQILPFIDEMVFFDGNSTDGTIEIIEGIINKNPDGYKIKLVKDKDPKDLRDDYVRIFNECLHALSTDLAWFLHPDMWVINPKNILNIKESKATAMVTHLDSYAGEPDGPLMRFTDGRMELWKNIYRLRNPDFGAHYHGWYGAQDEDVYFREITGDHYEHHGSNIQAYPYEVRDSGLWVMHFSDVRPYERRLSRMVTSLMNQGYSEEEARKRAPEHPRVSLKSGNGFSLMSATYPKDFLEQKNA